jgi:poly(A) polymerase
LLQRYHTGPDGKPVKKAVVYTQKEHGIDPAKVDKDAVRIVQRLHQNGHDGYIVGGAVRDLLVGRVPKDYDIVTDAEPARIKRLFYRSRIIGKRFRLVHVYVGPKIYEVSTFRSISNGTVGNTYGSIDEDALRRDFSINALYFDPVASMLVDYVGGLKDIRARRLVPVIPLKTIFLEDPVRMLRGVKYAALTGFSLPFFTRWAIRKHATLLSQASVSRLGEEVLKILASGRAYEIFSQLARFKLLSAILPAFSERWAVKSAMSMALVSYVKELDDYVATGQDRSLRQLLRFLYKIPVAEAAEHHWPDTYSAWSAALQAAKDFLAPLTLPRIEVEEAVNALFVPPEPNQKLKRGRRKRKPGGQNTELAGLSAEAQPGATVQSSKSSSTRETSLAHKRVTSPRLTSSREAELLEPKEGKEKASVALPGQGLSRSAKRRRRRREGQVNDDSDAKPLDKAT